MENGNEIFVPNGKRSEVSPIARNIIESFRGITFTAEDADAIVKALVRSTRNWHCLSGRIEE